MPCYDPRGEETPSLQVRKRLDKLTRMLCSTLAILEEEEMLSDYSTWTWRELPKEVLDWWEEHKKFDAERTDG